MKIGITGASGFIGQRVAKAAVARGHAVTGFSRNPGRAIEHCGDVRAFNPGEPVDATGLDAIVHLAGESVLGPWTADKRKAILESRVLGTRSVAEGISAAGGRSTLVAASAIGYYGDTGDAIVDERAPAGEGFLADVSRRWEEESLKAEAAGSRVALLRIGFVMAADGGAMVILKRVFGLGLGGRLGSGNQWMSLVHVDDVAGMAVWAAETESASGAYNCVSPQPLRNSDFTARIATAMGRPAFCHAPAFVMKRLTGELSTLFLDSHRILPRRALDDGFTFRNGTAEQIIRESI